MSLWERDVIVDGWNQAKAAEAGKMVDDGAPPPTDAEWSEMLRRTEETVRSVH